MTKRIFSFLLALCLIVGLLPSVSIPHTHAAVTTATVTLFGEETTINAGETLYWADNGTEKPAEATADNWNYSFAITSDIPTVTLRNANYQYNASFIDAAYDGKLKVAYEGPNNVIVPMDANNTRYFIYYRSETDKVGYGKLYIEGAENATLNVTGGSKQSAMIKTAKKTYVTISGGTMSVEKTYEQGYYSTIEINYGKTTIENCNLTVKNNTAATSQRPVMAAGYANDYPVTIKNSNVLIEGNGRVGLAVGTWNSSAKIVNASYLIISGNSTVKVVNKYSDTNAYSGNGIYAKGIEVQDGSTLEVEGKLQALKITDTEKPAPDLSGYDGEWEMFTQKGGAAVTEYAESTYFKVAPAGQEPPACEHVDTTETEEVLEAATCGKAGTKKITVTCACGEVVEEKTVEIPATGDHVDTTETEEVLEAATCGKAGTKKITVTCACGEVVEEKTAEIPATGEHTYTDDFDAECNACDHVREAKTAVAQIGKAKYETLAQAVAAAAPEATIELLAPVEGSGIVINKSITIDFGGKTYTFNSPAVGSSGTQTLGFQILKNNTVTLKNGKLNVAEEAKTDFAMLIQNYANLTIEKMELDGTKLDRHEIKDYNYSYVLSNNSGKVVIADTTIIANDNGDGYAFDACKYDSYVAPTVEVKGESVINGIIEVTGGALTLTAGTVNGELAYTAGTVTKAEAVTLAAPEGLCWNKTTGALAAHKYDAVVTEPNCTEAGFTTHTCAYCDDSYVTDNVPAKGHKFNENGSCDNGCATTCPVINVVTGNKVSVNDNGAAVGQMHIFYVGYKNVNAGNWSAVKDAAKDIKGSPYGAKGYVVRTGLDNMNSVKLPENGKYVLFVNFEVDGTTKSVSKEITVDSVAKPIIKTENGKFTVEENGVEYKRSYIFYLSNTDKVDLENWYSVKRAAERQRPDSPYDTTTVNGFMSYGQLKNLNARTLPEKSGTYVLFVTYSDGEQDNLQVSAVITK